MKTIREHSGDVDVVLFPDNQPQITLRSSTENEDVRVVWPIRSSLELIKLLLVADALDRQFARKRELVIPYLLGARSDRQMLPGGAVTLKVVADLINSCGFERVKIFDPHSEAALTLIQRSSAIDNRLLVERYDRENALLICPDLGAAKKIQSYRDWNSNIVDTVYCVKDRNPADGRVALRLLEPARTENRNCVIVDDICDGGATFLAIAGQVLRPSSLTLIVSHGIFSKGLRTLLDKFDQIIVSDSYSTYGEISRLTVVPLNL